MLKMLDLALKTTSTYVLNTKMTQENKKMFNSLKVVVIAVVVQHVVFLVVARFVAGYSSVWRY